MKFVRWDGTKTPEMSGNSMSKSLQRSVEIQISNKTKAVTLYNPRSYCFSGYSLTPPTPSIPPGATESCQFTNLVNRFRGAVGLLVYEADTFTLAILFSNPFDYNLYHMELAMEISLHKAHLGPLEDLYTRMYSGHPASTGRDTMFHRVKISACQEPVVVAAGHVKVMATMSNAGNSIVKVVLENQDCPTP